MSDYLEVVQFKKRGEKWRVIRLGSAKKNDKGGLDVWLDSLPIADAEGGVRLTIQAKQDKEEGYSRREEPRQPARHDLDDAIPF